MCGRRDAGKRVSRSGWRRIVWRSWRWGFVRVREGGLRLSDQGGGVTGDLRTGFDAQRRWKWCWGLGSRRPVPCRRCAGLMRRRGVLLCVNVNTESMKDVSQLSRNCNETIVAFSNPCVCAVFTDRIYLIGLEAAQLDVISRALRVVQTSTT